MVEAPDKFKLLICEPHHCHADEWVLCEVEIGLAVFFFELIQLATQQVLIEYIAVVYQTKVCFSLLENDKLGIFHTLIDNCRA